MVESYSNWWKTLGKGEIARYGQFLLFPQCFQKACFPGASKDVIVWEWVKPLPNDNFLNWSKLEAFADNITKVTDKLKFVLGKVENILGNGENAGYQHFLLVPLCFQKASYTGLFKIMIVW